jgi:hypothetical protein
MDDMDKTDNLNLPYILPSQAQKHVTHNEAIRALDAMLHLAVLSRAIANPPENPVSGDRYIVPSDPTGNWTGKETSVAAWQDGAWAFYVPREGWLAHVLDENRILVFKAGSWSPAAFAVAIPDQVGINTSADTTNRLAVASPASLFTNDGAGHQIKINKAATAYTASLLYQTAWSGRAEMGLAGNDAFSIKVSPDGATFRQAIVINPTTGKPEFPCGADLR